MCWRVNGQTKTACAEFIRYPNTLKKRDAGPKARSRNGLKEVGVTETEYLLATAARTAEAMHAQGTLLPCLLCHYKRHAAATLPGQAEPGSF
jgi:hypothetical protein